MASPAPVATSLVVIAEDEETVRDLLARCLQADGYTTLAAADGAAALALLESLPSPADLLIADIRMPHLSGDAVAFRALDQGLVRQVLFITGYDMHPETAQMLGPVLLKPFGPDDLSRAVKAVMRGEMPIQDRTRIR